MGGDQGGSGAAIGAAAGAAGGITSSIVGTIWALTEGMKETSESRRKRHIWEGALPDANRLLQSLYSNPAAEGYGLPYSGGEHYKYAPAQSMQDLYSNYLNREYGLPENVASTMRAQALKPIRLPSLPSRATPAQVRKATTLDPQALAGSALGRKAPDIQRDLGFMKNQGQLAAFNLWRAQQLGQIIG